MTPRNTEQLLQKKRLVTFHRHNSIKCAKKNYQLRFCSNNNFPEIQGSSES